VKAKIRPYAVELALPPEQRWDDLPTDPRVYEKAPSAT